MNVEIEEILERESLEMGRPCRAITQTVQVYRDPLDVEHETWLVIYDCSSDRQWQTRWTVWTDGEPRTSGIIAATTRVGAVR